MHGVDGAAARRRDRRLRQFLRHEQLSVKMHVAAALHHSARRGARVDAATQSMNSTDAAICAAIATLAPVIEYVAPVPAVHATSETLIESVALAPAVANATPAPVTEYVTPTPTDFVAAPARVVEHVAPASVTEYIAPPSEETCFSLSVDTTGFMNPQFFVPAVEASASQVVGSFPSVDKLASPDPCTTKSIWNRSLPSNEERVQQHTMPILQIQGQIVESVQVIPRELFRERIEEQIVDIPVPPIVEERAEVAQIIPQERFQQSTVEKIVVVPVPQPAPAVSYTAPAPVIEDVTPAPAVACATPVPVIENVAPSPVIEYIAPAPRVTIFSSSQQFPPAYTMDTTGLVKPRCSTTAVGGAQLTGRGSISPVDEYAAPGDP